MGDTLDITPAAAGAAGQLMSTSADDAATAGSAFFAAGAAVTGPITCGGSVGASAAAFGEAFGRLCADLVESAEGLGTLIQQSAALHAATDARSTSRFHGLGAI